MRPKEGGMLCLGIETSCDETAAAVVEEGFRIRSNRIASQVPVHREYGGVVPELAARHHVAAVTEVVDRALEEAGVELREIDLIAATRGPGLIGALLVGFSYAKALAWGAGLPLLGVHHLQAHIHAVELEADVACPFLCLVVSGGHTALVRVDDFGWYRILGRTRDDAAGEAMDKVARIMGLGYPGGPRIESLAREGDPGFVDFPRGMLRDDSLDFSFSGLKTAVVTFLRRNGWGPEGEGAAALQTRLPDLAASFQAAVVEVLVKKTLRAALDQRLERIVLAGGVAANRALRQALEHAASNRGLRLWVPSPLLCTDNAAMVAAAGIRAWRRGIRHDLTIQADAALPLPGTTAAGGGGGT